MQLWLWPDAFNAANALVVTEIGLRGHEKTWAIIGIIAALLKLIGLACRMSRTTAVYSAGLLVSGLFMSTVFWLTVSLSTVIDFPHRITPIALTGFAIAAAWQLAEWNRPARMD